MSIRIMTLVWEFSKHSGGDLLTLLAIADHADDNGRAYPSTDRLAQKTRMTRRNIINVLKNLSKSGEVKIFHNAGPRGCNRYEIDISVLLSYGENFSREEISHGVKNFPVKNDDPKFHTNHQEPSVKKKPKTKKEKAKKKETPFPLDFEITPQMESWGEKTFPDIDLEKTTEAWKDSMLAKGYERIDWQAAWRTGIRKAVEWKSAVKKPMDWSSL